jgi:alkanesulfonate monooxygenase SsuD/methylene tetrahydromethanopterin reductase-like flavin-dependent oxidoreductase (luciferase family)
MLRLTGRLGDGWLPSLGGDYLDPADVPAAQAKVDEGAERAGRDPAEIMRAANVLGLDGPPEAWADELAHVAGLGFTTLLVSAPDDDAIEWLGADTAPRLRELVG